MSGVLIMAGWEALNPGSADVHTRSDPGLRAGGMPCKDAPGGGVKQCDGSAEERTPW